VKGPQTDEEKRREEKRRDGGMVNKGAAGDANINT
jgi:hypothetical protein